MKKRKPRIFFMMSYFSHQNCTFPTAKKLEQAHFDVSYCGPPKSAEGDNMTLNVTKQGFKYIELDPRNKSFYSSHFLRNKTHENTQSMFLSLLYNLQDGRLFEKFVQEHNPDLIVLDAHYAPFYIPFSYHGIQVVLASTKINLDKDQGVPPVNSSLIPERSISNTNKIIKAWEDELKQKQKFDKFYNFLEEVSEQYHFDFDHYFYKERAIVPVGFRIPELIFWDLAYDFPRTEEGLRDKYYLGNQVDVSRKEDDLDMKGGDLIYVSLGSRLNYMHDEKLSLLRKILFVASKLLHYQFIITTREYKDILQEDVISKNVSLLPKAPQISLLSKSILMVTHAGGNSIKECIRMGVLMLCYPFEHDQFGNAARVVYHKLGLRGDGASDTVEVIQRKILSILENPIYYERIRDFQKRSVGAEQSDYDVKVITQFLPK